MSADIVTRLREATQVYQNQWHEECREAAEEIERLRRVITVLRGMYPEWVAELEAIL